MIKEPRRVFRVSRLAAVERNAFAYRRLRRSALIGFTLLFLAALFSFTGLWKFFLGAALGYAAKLLSDLDCALDVSIERQRHRSTGRHSAPPSPGAHPRPGARNRA